jgi:hypothetical protein
MIVLLDFPIRCWLCNIDFEKLNDYLLDEILNPNNKNDVQSDIPQFIKKFKN